MGEARQAVLVDVRERFEYVSGHVTGVMSLPIGELVVRGRELPGVGDGFT